MRICYIDAFSGISGDMTVGALLDAGADFAGLERTLGALGTGATFRFEKTKRRGIAAGKFYVDGGESKSHRHLSHIVKMIDAAPMSSRVKDLSKRIFHTLGESEAKVHAQPLEKVHFHEVGAVDSICDIVGAAFCLDSLGVEEIRCSPINAGSGTVKTEHGILPVPAPATADLLAGKPIYARGPEMELTTPTGAAIIATLATGFGPVPPMSVRSIGYGAGDRDFPEHANVLRVMIGDLQQASEATSITVIETNIDNATPEVLGYAMERLLEAGALDVTLAPVFMKKNRPGTMLTVLTAPEHEATLVRVLFEETGTLGVRTHRAERQVRAREFVEVVVHGETVRIKTAGGTYSPEYEDCRRVARDKGVPLKQVLADATLAYLRSNR